MGAIGDMDSYVKFKAARAVGDAANKPGTAGDVTAMGLSLGTAMAAGQVLAQSIAGASQPAAPAASAAPAATDPMETLKQL